MKTAVMKIPSILRRYASIAGCSFLFLTSAFSQDSTCNGIADQVTAAVSKEPGRVLMIVEDALVINEKCACEIIRAAILASKADATLLNQIVQTAISVTPKMSGVIMDCASAIAPGAPIINQADPSQQSGKDAKNPIPVVAPAVEDDFNPVPSSIRGVYLMQPPAGGFLPRTCDKNCISPTQANSNYP
jgi:hypothetical protein